MMDDLLTAVSTWWSPERARSLVVAAIVMVVGVIAARLASGLIGRLVNARIGTNQGILARRIVWYGLLFIVLTTTLRQFGLDLGVLLGAAGILTVAIGFASQTSASNLISGIFLLAERPFTVGDVITVGATTGEVVAIDLLSVKLRTFDNLLVRIPNETLLKSEIRNLAGFPIRRIDIPVGVAYASDLERVADVLVRVSDDNPLCLDEPRPLFKVLRFGESAIDVELSVWVARENFLAVRTALFMGIQRAFAEARIEIPFPQRVVHPPGGARAASDGPPTPMVDPD